MTLLIAVVRREVHAGGQRRVDVPLEASRELAGPEAWRTAVYGCDVARQLGATLLPSLADGNVSVEGDDIDRLEREVDLPEGAIAELCPEPSLRESLRVRLDNIRFACRVARDIGDPTAAVEIG